MIICNCFWYFCCNSIQLTFIWVHNKDVQYSYYIVDVSAIIRPSKSWSLHECSSPRLSLSPKTYCIRKYLEEMQSTTLSRLFLMSGLKTLTWKHGSHWNILTIFFLIVTSHELQCIYQGPDTYLLFLILHTQQYHNILFSIFVSFLR